MLWTFFWEYGFQISLDKAYKAIRIAMNMIYRDEEKQYAKLWRYKATIKKCNVGSTIKIAIKWGFFLRFYLYLDACKRGFLAGYRKVIGVYGCHLKGRFRGQMLCRVGKDANENTFLITFAIVEIENKEIWRWLHTLLQDNIGTVAEIGWIFMFNQQKV